MTRQSTWDASYAQISRAESETQLLNNLIAITNSANFNMALRLASLVLKTYSAQQKPPSNTLKIKKKKQIYVLSIPSRFLKWSMISSSMLSYSPLECIHVDFLYKHRYSRPRTHKAIPLWGNESTLCISQVFINKYIHLCYEGIRSRGRDTATLSNVPRSHKSGRLFNPSWSNLWWYTCCECLCWSYGILLNA